MSKYDRIRDLREDSDLTQKKVADSLFMHLTQYRRYETGERRYLFPSLSSLRRNTMFPWTTFREYPP